MKIGFVFPGQGSQYVGMGKDLCGNIEEARNIYAAASEALGYDVAELSFNGPEEELNKTYRTQPCLLATSVAALTALALRGIHPSFVAGHSLGEYSALVAAGSISLTDAARIAETRGKIMQDAVPEGKGLMAAVLGLERKALDDICSGISGYVSAANYNCPGQIVISGEKAAVEEAMVRAKAAGAKRAIPLAVSVPSHCRLMEEAGKRLEEELHRFAIKDPQIPFVNNVEAMVISGAEDIRKSLVRQMSRPVLWEDCVRAMALSGVGAFVEVGPGKVLSGLIKRIEPSAKILNVENMETLDKAVAELSQ